MLTITQDASTIVPSSFSTPRTYSGARILSTWVHRLWSTPLFHVQYSTTLVTLPYPSNLHLNFSTAPSSTCLPLIHVQELVCRQQVGTDSRHHLITMSNGSTPLSSALYVTSSPHRSRHSHRSLFSTLSLHKPCTYFSTQYTYFWLHLTVPVTVQYSSAAAFW